MAGLFQSFRSSSMPKRLLRYALSRLELLDSDALDLENLDLALGRNTVFEFRDVGVKLKKLEELLKLPEAFALQRAKVLLLRVTIPMDFYTSPILIEVDGVDVRVNVLSVDKLKSGQKSAAKTSDDTSVVPNTVDLAQSFLETQSSSERRRLEQALAADTQDLVASVSVSDDGSEEEPTLGTGQPLLLPAFLANFLQGIIDRMQIKIKGVTFQLDMEVPVDMSSPNTEPISFQIAMQDIDIEGVTMHASDAATSSIIAHKEGKRQISLANIRACLISEANLFPNLARSPSAPSSPSMTRNPPSSQPSSLSRGNIRGENMEASHQTLQEQLLQASQASLHDAQSSPLTTSQGSLPDELMGTSRADVRAEPMALSQSFQGHLANLEASDESKPHVGDSEEALGIPYDMSEHRREEGSQSPATPRTATIRGIGNFPEGEPAFSLQDQEISLSLAETLDTELRDSEPATSGHRISPFVHQSMQNFAALSRTPSSTESLPDELAQSQIYTHEEAESMYMSAFSHSGISSELRTNEDQGTPAPEVEDEGTPQVSQLLFRRFPQLSPHISPPESQRQSSEKTPVQSPRISPRPSPPKSLSPESQQAARQSPDQRPSQSPSTSSVLPLQHSISLPRAMPGGWADDDDIDAQANAAAIHARDEGVDSPISSPAFSRASLAEFPPSTQNRRDNSPHQDDVATPRGVARVVKEILHLQNISIYIPSQHTEADLADSVAGLARSMGTSVSPQAPGAFSVHISASEAVHGSEESAKNDKAKDNSVEVDISPMSVRFDASIAFILAMIVNKLLKAVKNDSSIMTAKSEDEDKQQKSPELKLTVQEISFDFLNLLGGLSDTPQRHLDPAPFMFEHEVLLNATLSSLAISMSPIQVTTPTFGKSKPSKQNATLTKVDLQRFRFGYANGDIISFNNVKPMSTSVRDTFLSNDHDVALKITQANDGITMDIETLPVALQIDLQRLDETFSWFGGLSSFLNMSASMTSSPAPTPAPAVIAPPRHKGVRFDTPINPEDKSNASENKVNLRIGGSFIGILGKECSVVAESNAIKLVSREEGIGMACSMMRLSGPLLAGSLADPAINAEIGGVRLEFSTTPKDADLEKLLQLITPSKAKFDKDSDEIMVDTLLRQRRKGSVLRTNFETVQVRVKNMSQLTALPGLAEEMAKLATVAKYLPEDDRPGLLTLAKVQKLGMSVEIGGKIGHLGGEVKELEVGHISVPSLVAIAISGVSLKRNRTEELIGSSALFSSAEIANRGPVVMARMIGDEIEPVIRIKFQDIGIEYRVPTIMDILGLGNDATPQDFEESLAASVANLGDQAHIALARQSRSPAEVSKQTKPMTLDVAFCDCLIGLNPLKLQSKMVILLTNAQLEVVLPRDEVTKTVLNIHKASILLTDDASPRAIENPPVSTRRRSSSAASPQAIELSAQGFVEICYISSATITVNIAPNPDGEKQVAVEVRDDLLVLETCADSTQTLIALANALSPPTPPSKENKYRTNVVPVQDLLASISAEAFGRAEGEYDFDQDFAGAQELAGERSDNDSGPENSLRIESQFYGEGIEREALFDATRVSHSTMQDTREGVLITNPSASFISEGDDLVIHDDFYNDGNTEEHTAKVWNSGTNSYDKAPTDLVKRSPLRVSVRDVHLIWNLFDGYDWAHTRDVISKAVQDVEAKAYERQARLSGAQMYEEELEDEETIGDFLFNSIYIGIPANRDPQDLSRAINEGLHDNATETESIAPTTVTTTTNRTNRRSFPRPRRLKLHRSKHHKITFELHDVNLDMYVYPGDAGETLSSIDVKVGDLDIFDHIFTSTWKKFATYDQDKGEREMGKSMVHLELLNVRPLPDLGASEIVMRATILPLRLHVDQDALDFITRFFEFKDDSVVVPSSPSDVPFLQRAEVNDVSVKLDFKPKRVDYAGLRSGHTTEFMNFIVLEESRMVLRHVIIYGVSGFERLGRTLQDIWTPDVRNNQLPGVIAGLAPVRSLVNIGSGFRDLVEIPLREYKRDGRVIRSISKGAAAFARTTGTELVKFGAKLAVGTQYALQGAEEMLSDRPREGNWEEDELEEDERRQISLYADQPTGVIQGIRGGYRSLARDVNLARDAIIAVPGEVMESSSPAGAAKAVLRRAPTIIFRPAVGVTRAIGQTLMGATNSIDPHHQRRIDEKYKKH